MILDDFSHACRRIRSKPATVLGAALLLALAIGVVTAMFTVIDALLLRAVPFRDAARLARVYMGNDFGGNTTVAPAVFRAWRSSVAFEQVESALGSTSVIESSSGVIARGSAQVSPGLFAILGVQPLRGRVFAEGDGRPGTLDRIVISEDLWRSVWASDPALVGRSIVVDGEKVQIVGIVPADFRFPNWNTVLWRVVDVDVARPGRTVDRPAAFVKFSRALPRADALRVATDVAHGAGTLGSWWLVRALASLQYGVTTADPLSWAVVIGTLATVTIAATWIPARRAASVDPVALLRDE